MAGDRLQHPTGPTGSKDFMRKLKGRLTDGGSDSLSHVNSQEMLKALKDGTLGVTKSRNWWNGDRLRA
ncbi:hypothetical protein [Rhizobium leguminosarum]|uniref:hypothetical protein n=1 Tax=Rhizobium leguminosarum TaxID=384 RepID=UPI0004809073|nr:hypothetical protein [Rhizobium leguminosarum]TBZ08762.1 hypothetical protein E0H38_27945 [Rhizobium leguminosarum bv. viciae]